MQRGPLAAQAVVMQPMSTMESQAEMAYRTSYLTQQYHRPGARARHHHSAAAATRGRILTRIRWRPRPSSTD